MKNKESTKIGWTFLGFFYYFLQISKVLLKKKRANPEQYWAESSPGWPTASRSARACAAVFADKALSFWITASGHYALFTRVTNRLQKGPWISIPSQTKVHDDGEYGRGPMSL
jgi:hypothetical protein